jgi:hypothetical protein
MTHADKLMDRIFSLYYFFFKYKDVYHITLLPACLSVYPHLILLGVLWDHLAVYMYVDPTPNFFFYMVSTL